ncbi:bacterial proteasome activator family protein [Sediminivirga luteola]|uniref:bacterial proteasome activator family protein n=1 Tax=Sediminivirga luteola TaxID=1774748 RepID=UPI0024125B0D|nr:bacterial proteasome activator family protein [Sediminivirga luteola]
MSENPMTGQHDGDAADLPLEGMPAGGAEDGGDTAPGAGGQQSGHDGAEGGHGDHHEPAVSSPAKVMRIGTMVKQLLDEVKAAPLDEASRTRLAEVYRRSITELQEGLSQELIDELERLSLPFSDDGAPPSEAELRIAQAQLVGWLEGLFHGIQTALMAQQMAAQKQLQQMRGALPPTMVQQRPGQPGPQAAGPEEGTGHYL